MRKEEKNTKKYYITREDKYTGERTSRLCNVIGYGFSSRNNSFHFEETIKVSLNLTIGEFFVRDGKQVGNVFGEAYLEVLDTDQQIVHRGARNY